MKNFLLMVMLSVLTFGSPAHAGEWKNAEYSFEIKWPDTLIRDSQSEDNSNILFLADKGKNLVLLLSVTSAATQGEEFLKSPDCTPEGGKHPTVKRHLDTMIKVDGRPARLVIFQTTGSIMVGSLATLAHRTLYVLSGISKKKTAIGFQAWFEKIIASLHFTGPGQSDSPVVAGLAGAWKVSFNGHPGSLEITGSTGSYHGRCNVDGAWEELLDVQGKGTSISFRRAKADQRYQGSRKGDTMSGTFSQSGSGNYSWTAERPPASVPQSPGRPEESEPGPAKPVAGTAAENKTEPPSPDEFGSDF